MAVPTKSDGLWSQAKDVLLGLCIGAAVSALVWEFYPGFWQSSPDAELARALQRREMLMQHQHVQRPAIAPASVEDAAPPSACALEPLIPVSGAADGRLRMEHPFPASPRAKAKVFLRKAQRAIASGRARDAEVALIAACRYDAQASTAPTVPRARVLGLLADRYSVAAAGETSPGLRERLFSRARDLLKLSAVTYAEALGPNAPLSRKARDRIASFDQFATAAADTPQPGEPLRVTAPAQREAPTPASFSPKRGATAARDVQQAAARKAPAFPAVDATAPQPPENSDPELRQLASDLARLRAQAEAVSDDPEGLQRRAKRAERLRAQCRDSACLRSWYARRRQELLAEF